MAIGSRPTLSKVLDAAAEEMASADSRLQDIAEIIPDITDELELHAGPDAILSDEEVAEVVDALRRRLPDLLLRDYSLKKTTDAVERAMEEVRARFGIDEPVDHSKKNKPGEEGESEEDDDGFETVDLEEGGIIPTDIDPDDDW